MAGTLTDGNQYLTMPTDFLLPLSLSITSSSNQIFLLNKGKQLCAPTCVRSDDGEVLYKSRFFVDPNKDECKQKTEELEKVVKQQQNVIKKVSEQLKILEDKSHEVQCENYDLRSTVEEKDNEIKELLIKEKKYKLVLSRFIS